MKKIAEEVKDFLDEAGIPAAELSRESGVHEVYISRLRTGKTQDIFSSRADALRAAMKRIKQKLADKTDTAGEF
jgi:predicted transcriptional regulator